MSEALGEVGAALLDLALAIAAWLGELVLAFLWWLTGLYDLAVAAWLPPTYSAILLDPQYHTAPLLMAQLLLGYIAWNMFRARLRRGHSAPTEDEERLQPQHTPWLLVRLDDLLIALQLRRPRDLWRVGGELVDRRYYPHSAESGTSGSGKTNAIAATRINGERPTVINTFDFSGPLLGSVQALEDKCPGSTVIWTPQGVVGLDLFLGTPREVARRWTAAFDDGSSIGQYKRAMRRRMKLAIEELDEQGELRTIEGFMNHLDPQWRQQHCQLCGVEVVALDRGGPYDHIYDLDHDARPYEDRLSTLEKGALESWLLRLEDLRDDLSPTALGQDLDLAWCLQKGKTVFFHLDAAVQTGTLAALAGLLVQENIRCIRKVRGGFRVVIEEAGAVVAQLDAFRLLLQAGRVRGVYVDVILQSLSQLPEFFRQNIQIWVLFQQEEEKAKRSAAERTGLRPIDFDARRLQRYYAWLKYGKVLKKITFAKAPEAGYEVDWEDEYYGDAEDEPTRPVPTAPDPPPVRPRRGAATEKDPAPLRPRRSDLPRGAATQKGAVAGTRWAPASLATPREQNSDVAEAWTQPISPSVADAPATGVAGGLPAAELSAWDAFNSSSVWLNVWHMLGRPTSEEPCWLVPEQKVDGNGRASFDMGGKKIGMPAMYRQFNQPNGKLEPRGPRKKWQCDHVCHTNDETCPGGKGKSSPCQHLRCVNPFHAEPVTTVEQLARQSQQHRRYITWLRQQADDGQPRRRKFEVVA